jgi:D-aspartate ligase
VVVTISSIRHLRFEGRPTCHAGLTPAIVIGLDDVRGVYAARTLARRGVPVIGISKRRGSYGSRTNVCPEILYADVTSMELFEVLRSLAARLPHGAVLVPCLDQIVIHISRHRDDLAPTFLVALPPPNVVDTLTDKVAFYSYAATNGFSIPDTHFLFNRSEAEHLAYSIEYPCVLKPASSKTVTWLETTNLKAFRTETPEDLLRLYDQFCSTATPLIVQQWISGDDSELYACISYFDRNAHPLVVFVSRKLRQWPPMTGEISLGQECRNDVVAMESVRLLQSVNYHGIAYVEFKRDTRTGEYFIIEPNIGRPAVRSGLVEASGVELLYTMYCDLLGLPLPVCREQRYESRKWLYLRRDVLAALYYWRAGELPTTQWIESLRGPKEFALFSLSDPKPFLFDALEAGRKFLKPSERARRNFKRPISVAPASAPDKDLGRGEYGTR